MSVYGGDFLGFQIGDTHSKNLNIIRVSSGDRYADSLIPNFKDSILEVSGVEGTYYQGTKYSNRTFNIEFAYDNLGDNELRELRKLFGFKGIQPLIFDEFPYKKYMVKCQTPPSLKYVCFKDPLNDGRVFKGEGSVQLIAYYPFGISTDIFSYTLSELADQDNKITNSGDLSADFCVYYDIHQLSFTNNSNIEGASFTLSNEFTNESLTVEGLKNIGVPNVQGGRTKDYYLMINTKTHLLEGLDQNYKKTGNLYNRFVTTGDFFKLQVGDNRITSQSLLGSSNDYSFVKIEYSRLYY